MTTTRVAVPRKGRPLEAVLERLAGRTGTTDLADDIISTLRYEKAVTKGNQDAVADVYRRISDYSSLDEPYRPEYTLLRDDRDGMPRRIVFDSVTIPTEHGDVQLVGREEPFRALRTHEFALGFDSADLVLEEVVQLRDDPLTAIHEINDRIDPLDTDVRVVTGLGDTVYHTLLATPEVLDSQDGPLDRAFVTNYEGDLCISPRYERLVEAVLGTSALDGVSFTYPTEGGEEEEDIAATGLGVYLTVTGSTARDHGLELGERLFPSETVLLENAHERTETTKQVASLFEEPEETALQSV
ncbi:hypothetical protein SAMN05443574_12219 [Haloarcula vallismortis]|uniref:ATP phosphoribosyltransferase n=2 Tax=Haloarcula vallismortis TaxID=28442 RepID=M0JPZ1_HALVA|nr:hypothetical protein [Haloarcula vallismortis]EMA11207.1 hypothetical protein C437_01947 [Haloarcula vallismortis ATCC 29715]SDX25473.1 hypothetical protein SAMN05443574_12219 [Haloarcula vallismortis]